ncbi:MAG: 4-hydroxy-3-methylbut-2-enyl diphosphate reductase [bacterium]|nr:4-hydroxy-3-methylbut-2-enyl diphosphate reductase [bacterium]
MKRVLLAQPRGFCAGVDRAVDIIDELLRNAGETVYVRKEVVHNRVVVEGFRQRGAIFVDELDQVPAGSLVVYSAHGVSPEVRERAKDLRLHSIDATCPLVTKVHREVRRFIDAGCRVVLIGHAGHEEVEGTMGHGYGNIALIQNEDEARAFQHAGPEPLAIVSQTTLAVSDVRRIIEILQERFGNVELPPVSDICYATENRQNAVRALAPHCEAVIVVGSANSSNSRSLRDVAEQLGARGYLTDDPAAIRAEWLAGVTTLGVTAGASSPEGLVEAVIARVRELDPEFVTVEPFGQSEPPMTFRPPKEFTDLLATVGAGETRAQAG